VRGQAVQGEDVAMREDGSTYGATMASSLYSPAISAYFALQSWDVSPCFLFRFFNSLPVYGVTV
jgi:hypothetical protein